MTGLRISLYVSCCLVVCCVTSLLATPPLPYQAEIMSDHVVYRSGPGERYYVCGHLQRGEIVEVYQQQETGFLAIRPPRGASSWVLASDVAPTREESIGRIVRPRVISWIDSELSSASDDQWQVELKEDELVEILEKRSVPGQPAETADQYYRITPPSGEFRWIHTRFLQPVREAVSLIDSMPSTSGVGSIQLIQYPQDTTQLPADGWRDRRLANINPLPSAPAVRVAQTNPGPTAPVRSQPADVEPRERFQPPTSQLLPDPKPNASKSPVSVAETPSYRIGGVSYHGVGWLMPVYGKDRSLPPFALLDNEGKLLQYVIPGPGVNLRRYARKEVGILGSRVLVKRGEVNRLTAYRVIDLSRHR